MTSEKDYTKRLIKELVDYCLYHEMGKLNIQVNYREGDCLEMTVTAFYPKVPYDLELFREGLEAEKQTELDEMYNVLMGSHSRDKDYTTIGQAIDDYDLEVANGLFKLKVLRHFDQDGEFGY